MSKAAVAAVVVDVLTDATRKSPKSFTGRVNDRDTNFKSTSNNYLM
jgi:hypothetical protein